jgi:hypothetical protein
MRQRLARLALIISPFLAAAAGLVAARFFVN